MYDDTIVAVSTPVGNGGIGIVRLSGENSAEIAGKLFSGKIDAWRLSYGSIVDPESGEVADEVLVSFMPAPRSYTREDVVEINCHGGALAMERVLELCLRQGARLASPGEFTLRAFLNGRIDLAQAESVVDIIEAKTAASLRVAVDGLRGNLSNEVRSIRREIMDALAELTARIDFPEDEVQDGDISSPLDRSLGRLDRLIENADAGMVYRQGVRTAIVGRPNVGKSSLLNLLLGENRAIVTAVPGTTRDTVEETVNIRGVPFVLVDTAGIVKTNDTVESLGIERSRRAIERADLVLMVVDSSQPLQESDREIFVLLVGKTVIVPANKVDLPWRADLSTLSWPVVEISALGGTGVEKLKESMLKVALGGKTVPSDGLLVSNPRHKDALVRGRRHLNQALDGLKTGVSDDMLTIDLASALNALGEITGETVGEDLLNTIFSRFCLGK